MAIKVIVKFINPRRNEGLAMQAQNQVPMRGKIYLANAFSISMLIPILKQVKATNVRFELISAETAKLFLMHGFTSAVGYQTTASALSKILGIDVPVNRATIQLQPEDVLIVFQIDVGRLQPGRELSEQEIINAYSEGRAFFVLVYSPETVEPPRE